jgi:hypothetical protein
MVAKNNELGSGPMTGARVFVGIGFLILATSFIASTGVLIYEFASIDWLTMILAHSHLFLFFPLLGTLGLVAFYLPSVVFTHLYWTHLPGGKVRLLLGIVAIGALSLGVFWYLDAKPRHAWEVSPAALGTDKGETLRCSGDGQICHRVPITDALANLRLDAQDRLGLWPFGRNCSVDPLLELPNDMQRLRWCFPAKAMLGGVACCQVQARFAKVIASMQADPSTRSLSGKLDAYFLPFKIFFVLIVVLIGGLLAVWRSKLDEHYQALIPSIERGIIVGAMAMVAWALMDYGYQEVADALFGRWTEGLPIRLSLVVGPWTLLLLFYFLRHLEKYSAVIGQISGAVIAAVYVLRYESVNDWSVLLLGIGASPLSIALLAAMSFAGVLWIIWPRSSKEATQQLSFRA